WIGCHACSLVGRGYCLICSIRDLAGRLRGIAHRVRRRLCRVCGSARLSKAGRLSKTANLRLLGGFRSSRCALRLGRCLLCFCCSFGSSLLCLLRFLRSLCRLLFCLLARFFLFFCLFRIDLL